MNRFLFIFLFVAAVACDSDDDGIPAGEWTLTAMPGEDLTDLTTPITLRFNTKKAKGFAGCNEYFSGYSIKKSAIRFSEIGRTDKLCRETIDLESKFLETLDMITEFSVKGGKLQLLQNNVVVLEFEK